MLYVLFSLVTDVDSGECQPDLATCLSEVRHAAHSSAQNNYVDAHTFVRCSCKCCFHN